MEPDARFCAACGTAFAPNGFAQTPIGGRLMRPRHPRVIGGVCSGLALHYGWDVSLVRLILVLCVLFAGTGLFTYILAWIIIPEAPYDLPQPTGGVSA